MNYREHVDAYIKSKELAWSPNTLRSEMYRLRGVASDMPLGPDALYRKLAIKMKPYAIKTTFIRIGEFYQWLMITGKVDKGENPFKDFMLVNGRLFKNAYKKEQLDVDYKEALARIKDIKDPESRKKAQQLLASGQRYEESFTSEHGHIIGKGGKRRPDFTPANLKDAASYSRSYDTFLRHLSEVGLKPHQLRKLKATQLGEHGATEADLLKVFGWNNIQTASSYLQAKKGEKLQRLIKKSNS